MSGYLIGPSGVAVAVAGGTLTYTTTDVSQANSGSGTFTGVAIGAVAADRVIVVTIATSSNSQANGAPTSVTVGGVAMTLQASATNAIAVQMFVYTLLAPSGVLNATTATIQVNCLFATSFGISVGNLNGSAAASLRDSNSDTWSGAGSVADPRGVPNDLAAVAVASGGVVITGWAVDRAITASVNSANTTIDFHAVAGAPDFIQAHGTNGSPSFNGATNFNCNFVIASFQP